jgi:NAD(P)-dependent dehydrogenase (short-subunit alcohol dehydrogenase family)
MEAMAREALARFGRIDILVASAAVSPGTARTLGRRAAVADLPLEAWDEIVDTNLRGVFLANRAVLPAMIRQGRGDIVNVSAAIVTSSHWAFAAPYCASKFGLMGLSEALAAEAAGHGVRVQVMVPDVVDTPMLAQSQIPYVRAVPGQEAAGLILRMLGEPEDLLMENPLIEPFGTWPKAGRRAASGG